MNHAKREEFVRQLVRHERLLHAYIFSMVLDWSAAEEILQETYLRLFEQIDEWDQTQELYPWACGFARYQVLNYRNRRRRQKLEFSQAFVDGVAGIQETKSDQLMMRLEALEHCIERLAPPQKKLLELAYRGDLSVDQISQQVGRSVAATYQVLTRVRKLLKECVERAIRTLE